MCQENSKLLSGTFNVFHSISVTFIGFSGPVDLYIAFSVPVDLYLLYCVSGQRSCHKFVEEFRFLIHGCFSRVSTVYLPLPHVGFKGGPASVHIP